MGHCNLCIHNRDNVRQPVLCRPYYIYSRYVQGAKDCFRAELLRWLPNLTLG